MDEKAQYMIQHIKDAAAYHNTNALSIKQYKTYRLKECPIAPSPGVIYKKLGNWGDTLKLAGLQGGERKLLRCTSCGTRFIPTDDQQIYCDDCMNNELIRELEKDIERKKSDSLSKEGMIDSLQKADSLIDGPLTIRNYEFTKLLPSFKLILNAFGSWPDALKAAGLYKEYDEKNPHYFQYSNYYLLKNLQRVTNELNVNYLQRSDYIKACSKPSSSVYIHRFGSWDEALILAGLLTPYSEETLLKALKEASDQVEGILTVAKYKALILSPSATTIIRRYGTWRNAILTLKQLYLN